MPTMRVFVATEADWVALPVPAVHQLCMRLCKDDWLLVVRLFGDAVVFVDHEHLLSRALFYLEVVMRAELLLCQMSRLQCITVQDVALFLCERLQAAPLILCCRRRANNCLSLHLREYLRLFLLAHFIDHETIYLYSVALARPI